MSESDCSLTPQARAFSTVLTAFVGSIVNSLTSGALVAFMTGWIAWLALMRVLTGSLVSLYQAFQSNYTKLEQTPRGASQAAESIPMEEQGMISNGAETPGQAGADVAGISRLQQSGPSQRLKGRIKKDVTVLGWLGWLYTAIYSPIVQALWIAANFSSASGSLKIVRALGISVSALALTIDTKKRYATKMGGLAGACFNLINGLSAFGMGVMCAALLIKGAYDAHLGWYLYLIYGIFSVIWAAASFGICPTQDGGIQGFGIVPDVLVGAFAGVFLAAAAFAVLQTAEQPTVDTSTYSFTTPESGSTSLRGYLGCEGVSTWRKFVAIFP